MGVSGGHPLDTFDDAILLLSISIALFSPTLPFAVSNIESVGKRSGVGGCVVGIEPMPWVASSTFSVSWWPLSAGNEGVCSKVGSVFGGAMCVSTCFKLIGGSRALIRF